MIVILDASTLVNLANGEVLSIILSIPGIRFQVSQVVKGESKSVAAAVDAAISTKMLSLVDDLKISANEFSEAKKQMNLDDGETECILAARALDCTIACDDRAARTIICSSFGTSRLTGSIGLLRLAINVGLLSSEAAFAAYALMRERGGYLPNLAKADF